MICVRINGINQRNKLSVKCVMAIRWDVEQKCQQARATQYRQEWAFLVLMAELVPFERREPDKREYIVR